MKILIVDDESLVRIGIKSCIPWSDYDMQIIGEAEDGHSAIEMIKELNPDVVLLDIKIPGIDGITVLRRIKELDIDCEVIMLSGFDDYEYVRNALKYGAIDYFHKPKMNSTELLQTLLEIKSHRQKAFLGDQYHNKQYVLEELLTKTMSEERIDSLCRECSISLDFNSIVVANVNIGDIINVKKRYSEGNQLNYELALLNLMDEVFRFEKGIIFFKQSASIYTIVFGVDSLSQKAFHSYVHKNITTLMMTAKKIMDLNLNFGVSGVINNRVHLPNANNHAKLMLEKNFYDVESNIIYYDESNNEETSKKASERLISDLKTIEQCIDIEDYTASALAIRNLLRRVRDERILAAKELIITGEMLLHRLLDSVAYIEYSHLIKEVTSYQAFESLINKALEKYLSNNHTRFTGIDNYAVRRIMDFIDAHYKEALTLDRLSTELDMSSNYISALFKRETNCNLFDYINELRIKRGKHLLVTSSMKIYQIAEEVGFGSAVRFSVVFSDKEGLSPKDYRNKFRCIQ